MQRPTNDPRRVIEEPPRSVLPLFALAIVAAVGFWSIYQSFHVSTRGVTGKAQQPTDLSAHQSKGDIRTVFSADDYPVDAQRNGEEGTVQAQLTIDSQGRVSSCAILHSSGYASLDKATCNILRARARFTPARDVNGDAVPDRVVTPPVVWRLEG